MHEEDKEAIDQIDAMVFTSDSLHDEKARRTFREILLRWEKELIAIDKLKQEET